MIVGLIILLMLVLNAIFAAYEMALVSISRPRINTLINQRRRGSADAAFMKDNIEASLAVIQLGITLVGAIAAASGGAEVSLSITPFLIQEWGLSRWIASLLSLLLVIIPLSSLIIIFSELIPKTFALNNKVLVCLTLSPAMRLLFRITYPLIKIFERIVKWVIQIIYKTGPIKGLREDQFSWHELVAAVSLARTSRLIGAREEKIVLSAAQLSVRPLREAMIPIEDVFMIPLESRLSEALVRAHLDMHTRFPVCAQGSDPQTIQGYINFKDIVMALKLNPSDPSIKGILLPIKTLKEDLPLSLALERMMQEKLHIALVESSKDSQITGMVTLEDIIEELVGQIEDEYDRLPTHAHPYDAGWIMGGGLPMTTVNQITGKTIYQEAEGEPSPKLADWFAQKAGEALKGGEIIESQGLQFAVRKIRRKKLAETIVTRL